MIKEGAEKEEKTGS